jgi:hypothetical protein
MVRLRRCGCGENGAVLFAGCVEGVEGEGKDVETRVYPEIATTDSSAGGPTRMNTDERQKDGGKKIKTLTGGN